MVLLMRGRAHTDSALQICSYLDVADLLALTFTSKTFRSLVLSLGLGELPSRDIREVLNATLVFGKACQVRRLRRGWKSAKAAHTKNPGLRKEYSVG